MKKVMLVVVLLFAGCTITPEAKTQLNEGAVIGDKNMLEWQKLTPPQREQAHWGMVRIIHDLRYAILDVPVPDAYKGKFKATVGDDGKALKKEEKKDDLLDDKKTEPPKKEGK